MEFVKSSNHRMLERSVAEAVAYKLIKTQSGETSTKQIRITRPMLLDSPKPFENCFLLRKSKKYRFSLTRQPSLNDHQKHPHDATPMALEWCEASSLPVINYLELLGLNYPSASSASTFLNYTSATPTIKKKSTPTIQRQACGDVSAVRLLKKSGSTRLFTYSAGPHHLLGPCGGQLLARALITRMATHPMTMLWKWWLQPLKH